MAGWWMRGNSKKHYEKERRTLLGLSSKHRELKQAIARYRQIAMFLKGREIKILSFGEYLEKRPAILPFFQEQFRITGLPEVGVYLTYLPKKKKAVFPRDSVLKDKALDFKNWESALSYEDIEGAYDYLAEIFGEKQVVLLRYGPPVVFGVFLEGVSSSPSPSTPKHREGLMTLGRRNAGFSKR